MNRAVFFHPADPRNHNHRRRMQRVQKKAPQPPNKQRKKTPTDCIRRVPTPPETRPKPPKPKPPEPPKPPDIPGTSFTAPPPLAPPIPPDQKPSRYANARIGQWVVYRCPMPDGANATRRMEVLDVDPKSVLTRRTLSGPFGQSSCEIPLNRWNIPDKEIGARRIGTQTVVVAGQPLRCEIIETHSGGTVFRTLYCPEVFGQLVRHSDNSNGYWKTRLQLIDFFNPSEHRK